jgi:radical SAM superfamily enzyme YgiQ (UPF0313 family)
MGLGAVPKGVKKIVDVKTPSSGEDASFMMENLSLLDERDEIKFVIADRTDYTLARTFVEKHLAKAPQVVNFSPVRGAMPPRSSQGSYSPTARGTAQHPAPHYSVAGRRTEKMVGLRNGLLGHVIRPPSEAYSMIIQVTVGCSHNQCTFCGTYKDQRFRLKDMATIKRDIDEMSSYRYGFTRAFLADGDVLILPNEQSSRSFITLKRRTCDRTRRGVRKHQAILKKTPEGFPRSGTPGSASCTRALRAGTGSAPAH